MSELPGGWSEASIEDIFAVLADGRTLHQGWSPQCEKEPSKSEDDWGVLKTTSIQDGFFLPEQNKRLPDRLAPRQLIEVHPGDILMTCAGPRARCGISCLVRETRSHLMLSGKIYRFRVPEEYMDSRYVAFYLQTGTARFAIDRMKTGISDSGLNLTHERFRGLPIPIAPLAEQRRIVAAIEEQFSRLDAGVAALERARQNLRQMRAAALSDLLRAEDGRDFPEVPLGDLLTIGRYGTSTKCSVHGQGLPVLRIPNVQSGRIDLSDLKYAIDLSVDLERARVAEGDILIIRTNGSRSLIGRAALVPQIQYPIAFASYLIRLRVNPTVVMPEYIVASLAAPRIRARLEELAATTAGQYNISLGKLRSLRIPLPSLSQQRRALSIMDGRLSIADHVDDETENALMRANQLRFAILARAFAGTLVHQDPTDESASILLQRAATERTSSNVLRPGRPRKPRLPRKGISA